MVPADGPTRRGEKELLLLILAVSWALRLVLVWRGGQEYWPDEVRYERSRAAAAALSRGDAVAALKALDRPDHLLFAVLGVVPAAFERVVGPSTRVPAAFFATFSVASILLLWLLVRRLGEDEPVRVLAAFFFAASATQLYYARHLLPYDAALAFGLAALVTGFRSPCRVRDSIACGLLAAAATLTYEGCWILSALALIAHAAREPRSSGDARRRMFFSGVGFLAPLALVFGVDTVLGGNLTRGLVAFSRTVVQGAFEEGARLPLAYLWHAEHLLAVLWGIAIVWAAFRWGRGDRSPALRLGLGGVVFVYGALVVPSVLFRRMVVYGRLARPIVPLACVVTALMTASLARKPISGKLRAAGLIAGVALQAAFNFATPLRQTFPPEFLRLAEKAASSVPRGTLALVDVGHIYPGPDPAPAGCAVLLARPHPLEYLPYQYEGYRPAERAALRAADIRMRLVVCSAEPGSAP